MPWMASCLPVDDLVLQLRVFSADLGLRAPGTAALLEPRDAGGERDDLSRSQRRRGPAPPGASPGSKEGRGREREHSGTLRFLLF